MKLKNSLSLALHLCIASVFPIPTTVETTLKELLSSQRTTTTSSDLETQLSVEPHLNFCIAFLDFKAAPVIRIDFMTPEAGIPEDFNASQRNTCKEIVQKDFEMFLPEDVFG